jgi:hypothetical protein
VREPRPDAAGGSWPSRSIGRSVQAGVPKPGRDNCGAGNQTARNPGASMPCTFSTAPKSSQPSWRRDRPGVRSLVRLDRAWVTQTLREPRGSPRTGEIRGRRIAHLIGARCSQAPRDSSTGYGGAEPGKKTPSRAATASAVTFAAAATISTIPADRRHLLVRCPVGVVALRFPMGGRNLSHHAWMG